MQINIYHVDAFTDHLFGGNPAAVCLLREWLSDTVLNSIAKENNLPVTAFLVHEKEEFSIRWITPEYELDICGHGTLAASYVIFQYVEPNCQKIVFKTRTELLEVTRNKDKITLNFPVKPLEVCSLPVLKKGLGLQPKEMYQYKNERCLAVYETEERIKQLTPNIEILKKMPHRGITVTAPGTKSDFVSRTFYPQKSTFEDPATGASHCLLAPYWSHRLNKNEFHSLQLSQRVGEIYCYIQGDRVLISGRAVMYMKGIIDLKE